MLEHFIVGAIQGVAEWLPVSSEGAVVFMRAWLFSGELDLKELVRFSLFLHAGTFLAALVYLRADVWRILKSLFWHTPDEWTRATTRFLIVSTGVSGVIGFALLQVVQQAVFSLELGSYGLMAAVGALLVITGFIQLKRKTIPKGGFLQEKTNVVETLRGGGNLTLIDSLIAGIAQGFAVLPGISRSGSTVAVLLLRKIDDAEALRLSFLMSLPIVLAGNIILNAQFFLHINSANLVALGSSFFFGLLSIHALMHVARRVNFGWFVVGFGAAVILFSSNVFL
jgi:undecaprenyl-diphosphatase